MTADPAASDALRRRVEEAVGATFKVEEEIGRGGMAVVYRARDTRLRRHVALKVLPPELAFRTDVRSRFVREAQLAAQLSHPHIVPIYAVDDTGGVVYFAMGFVDGEPLARRLSREPRPDVAFVRRVLREVADGLAYAHAHGVVHRDIKPDNLHLGQDGQWRILDLGVALSGKEPEQLRVLHAGTPSYMNPEQWSDDPQEARAGQHSDLFALGVTLYQWLTGRLPYGEVEPYQMGRYRRDPVAPSRIRPDVPIWLDQIALKAVARDPKQRFETAEEMLLALERGASRPLGSVRHTPLLQRDPAGVWKLAFAISVLFNLLLLYWFLVIGRV